MTEKALDHGYWEGLKNHYEKEYNGIVPRKQDIEYIEELRSGGATLEYDDRRFDPIVVKEWVKETQQLAKEEAREGSFMNIYGEYEEKDIEDTEMLKLFPHLFDYVDSYDEIAAFYMWEDIDKFKQKIMDGDVEYMKEAIRLNWEMMLELMPEVRDIFLF